MPIKLRMQNYPKTKILYELLNFIALGQLVFVRLMANASGLLHDSLLYQFPCTFFVCLTLLEAGNSFSV